MVERRDVSTRWGWVGWWGLGLSMVVVVAVLVAGFAFAWPQTDDWLRLRLGWELGPWDAMVAEYRRWSGRWAGLLVVTATGWLLGQHVPLGWAGMGMWLVFAGAVVANVLRYLVWVPVGVRAGAGVVLSLWMWTRLPSVGDGVYWFTGVVDNLLGWGLVGWALAVMPWGGLRAGGWVRLMVAAVLTAVGCGTHELLAMGAVAMWAGVLAVGWWWGWRGWGGASVPMLAGLVSLAVVMASPGHAARTAELGGLSDPVRATVGTAVEVLLNYPAWLTDAGLWLLVLWVLTWATSRGGDGEAIRPPGGAGWLAAWLVAVSVLMLWGATWAIHARPPGRTVNLVFVPAVGAVVMLVAAWGPVWAAWLDGRMPGWRSVRGLLAGVLGVALLAGHNVGLGGLDLARRYWDYTAVMRERERLVAEYRSEGRRGVLTVPHVGHFPLSYHMGDIGPDPTSPVNVQWAEYYGVDAVVTTGVPKVGLR
ncbi:MAG: DUF6056 family protein [Tepidisphaerales bacterium]